MGVRAWDGGWACVLDVLAPSRHTFCSTHCKGNFTHVANYITKAESTPDFSDTVLAAQLKVASGLNHLEGKKYKLAARKFLECSPELGTGFSDVVSQQDVALYGGVLLKRQHTPSSSPKSHRRHCSLALACLTAFIANAAGLCALASFDRPELKSKLIDNAGFRTLLELAPDVCARPPSCAWSPSIPTEPECYIRLSMHSHYQGYLLLSRA